MEAKDLRIGNLFDVINRTHQVHIPTGIVLRIIAIGLFDVQCVPNEIKNHEATSDIILTIPIRDIVGISLTEEWLIRFGWQKCYSIFGGYLIDIGEGEKIRVVYDEVNGWHHPLNGYQRPKVNFVHQLQNFYHTLTGKELELK